MLVLAHRSTDGSHLGAQTSENLRIQAVFTWKLAHCEMIGIQADDKLFRLVEPCRALIDHLGRLSVSASVWCVDAMPGILP